MMSVRAMSSPVWVAGKWWLNKGWSFTFVAIFRFRHCLLSWVSKWFVNKVLKILTDHACLGINVCHYALLVFICLFKRLVGATVVVLVLGGLVKISLLFLFRHLPLLKTINHRTLARSRKFLIHRYTRSLRSTSITPTRLCLPVVLTCLAACVGWHHLRIAASSVLREAVIRILKLWLVITLNLWRTISLNLFGIPICRNWFVPMTVSVAFTIAIVIAVRFLSGRRPRSLIVLVLILSISLVSRT